MHKKFRVILKLHVSVFFEISLQFELDYEIKMKNTHYICQTMFKISGEKVDCINIKKNEFTAIARESKMKKKRFFKAQQ